jgi:hypothetical protein
MSEKRYRNVVISGDQISGEYTDKYSDFQRWTVFRGSLPLMRIRTAHEMSDSVLLEIMKKADGYGEPGLFPCGYDWSGIRDSSATAIAAMDEIAKKAWGNRPWPWEQ